MHLIGVLSVDTSILSIKFCQNKAAALTRSDEYFASVFAELGQTEVNVLKLLHSQRLLSSPLAPPPSIRPRVEEEVVRGGGMEGGRIKSPCRSCGSVDETRYDARRSLFT